MKTSAKFLFTATELATHLNVRSEELAGRLAVRYGIRRRRSRLRLRIDDSGQPMKREALFCLDPNYDIDGPAGRVRAEWIAQTLFPLIIKAVAEGSISRKEADLFFQRVAALGRKK